MRLVRRGCSSGRKPAQNRATRNRSHGAGAGGPTHHADGIVFLHTGFCETAFAELNDTTSYGCRSIGDLPVDVAITAQSTIRAALGLFERP